MDSLLFGTAGTPHSCSESSSNAGIKQVRKLGLDAMELEFVRGVHMKPDTAKLVGNTAKEHNVTLTAHAPYFINLNPKDNPKESHKLDASIKRILDTAKIASIAGAYSITFHPAFYLGMPSAQVYKTVLKHMKTIIQSCKDESIKLWVRPETTGKATQFGSYQEIVSLSQELDQVLPCIDFAHLHARTGKINTYDEFHKVLSEIESGLGSTAINNMHIHMSGINYSEKGERNHLELEYSDMNYKDLMKVLKEFSVSGVVISESPNLEKDAILMRNKYENA